jgi:hypothetical protein
LKDKSDRGDQNEAARAWSELCAKARRSLQEEQRREVTAGVTEGDVLQPRHPRAPAAVEFAVVRVIDSRVVLVPVDGLALVDDGDVVWRAAEPSAHVYVARSALAVAVEVPRLRGWIWCGELPKERIAELDSAWIRAARKTEHVCTDHELREHLDRIRAFVDELAPSRLRDSRPGELPG